MNSFVESFCHRRRSVKTKFNFAAENENEKKLKFRRDNNLENSEIYWKTKTCTIQKNKSIQNVRSASDDVRLPNVDDDEEKYGQIDQEGYKERYSENVAYNIEG